MLKKYTVTLLKTSAVQVPVGASRQLRRTIAKRHHFDFTPKPGYIYVRSRAISSRTNDNFDEFPAEEIAKAYKTFIGKPAFVNHVNDNHRRARGVIIDAVLHQNRLTDGHPDTWAEVLHEIDAQTFPKLAKAIIEGRIDRTSMGCDVEYSICSACGNKATTPAEYCQHIPRLKGKKISKRNPETGEVETHLIRETCYGLKFFENSLLVEEPADPTAYFTGVEDHSMSKAASLSEDWAKVPTDPLNYSECTSRRDNPTFCNWHKTDHLETDGEPRTDIDGHGKPMSSHTLDIPECDLCDGHHDSLHHYSQTEGDNGYKEDESVLNGIPMEGSLLQHFASADELDGPCTGGHCEDYPEPHTWNEHFDKHKARGLDAWGRPLMQPYDGHGAWSCNNYDCAEHPKEMYDQGAGPVGMPGWMQHDTQDPETKAVGREVGKHFHDLGQTEDARFLLDQQHQGPSKYSSVMPGVAHWCNDCGKTEGPGNKWATESGTCPRCGSTNVGNPHDRQPTFDEQASSHQGLENEINQIGGEHANWLLRQQPTGPTKYSLLRHFASADEEACGTDHWPRTVGADGKTYVGGPDALGDTDCGHPDCQYAPCDHEWCVKNEPPHTRQEHNYATPAHLDPYSDESMDAEKSMKETGLDEHPLAFLLEQNERDDGTNGPTKYSMRRTASNTEPIDLMIQHWDRVNLGHGQNNPQQREESLSHLKSLRDEGHTHVQRAGWERGKGYWKPVHPSTGVQSIEDAISGYAQRASEGNGDTTGIYSPEGMAEVYHPRVKALIDLQNQGFTHARWGRDYDGDEVNKWHGAMPTSGPTRFSMLQHFANVPEWGDDKYAPHPLDLLHEHIQVKHGLHQDEIPGAVRALGLVPEETGVDPDKSELHGKAHSYIQVHQALTALHKHLHDGDFTNPAKGWEGGVSDGHSHNMHTDPLMSGKHVPIGPNEFTDNRSPIYTGMPFSDYHRVKEFTTGLHPERTDAEPNVRAHHDISDPEDRTNLSACPKVYPDKFGLNEDDSPKVDPEEKCDHCGAYKILHAAHLPSEVGKVQPDILEERGRNFLNRDTKPIAPLRQSLNSHDDDDDYEEYDDSDEDENLGNYTHCMRCGEWADRSTGYHPGQVDQDNPEGRCSVPTTEEREDRIYQRLHPADYCGDNCRAGHAADIARGIGVHHTFNVDEGQDASISAGPHENPVSRQSGSYEVRKPGDQGLCHYCRTPLVDTGMTTLGMLSQHVAEWDDDEDEDDEGPKDWDSHISMDSHGYSAVANGEPLTPARRWDPEHGDHTHRYRSVDDALHHVLHKHHEDDEDSPIWVHGEHGPVYREADYQHEVNPHIEKHLRNYMGEGKYPSGKAPLHPPIDDYSSADDIRQHLREHHGEQIKDSDLHHHVNFGGNRLNELIDGIGRGIPNEEMHTKNPTKPVAVPKDHADLLSLHETLHEPGKCPAGDETCHYPNTHEHAARDTGDLFDNSVFGDADKRDAVRDLMEDGKGPTKHSKKDDGPTVSGVVLKAKDTGRVLMLQRSFKDKKDPARGTWEFPGGHHEDGDQTSLHAGIREWEEEVGQPFPDGGVVAHTWRSPNGIYQGHVVVIPKEEQVVLHDGRVTPNPDDPDGDDAEQAAWWDPKHAKENPALRREVKKAPWDEMRKAAALSSDLVYTSKAPPQRGRSNWTHTLHRTGCSAAKDAKPISEFSEGPEALLRKVRHSLGAKACGRCKPEVSKTSAYLDMPSRTRPEPKVFDQDTLWPVKVWTRDRATGERNGHYQGKSGGDTLSLCSRHLTQLRREVMDHNEHDTTHPHTAEVEAGFTPLDEGSCESCAGATEHTAHKTKRDFIGDQSLYGIKDVGDLDRHPQSESMESYGFHLGDDVIGKGGDTTGFDSFHHEVVDEPLSNIRYKEGQSHVLHPYVEHMAKTPQSEFDDEDRPFAQRMPDGTAILMEGHHRAAAASLRGDSTLKMDVYGKWGDGKTAKKKHPRHHHRQHHHHFHPASHPFHLPGRGWTGGWGGMGWFGGHSGYCCPGDSCVGVDTIEGADGAMGGDMSGGGDGGDGGGGDA